MNKLFVQRRRDSNITNVRVEDLRIASSKMNLKLFPSILLTLNVYAKLENDFLTDYFVYKKVPIIAGLSCNNIEEDFSLFNRFSKKGILSVFYNLYNDGNLDSILNVNYWKIGVFLDIRCFDHETVSSTFYEATENRMFDELHCWVILGSNLTDVLYVIDDKAFGISTDLVIAIVSEDENYELYDTYNIFSDRGIMLNVSYLGNWNLEAGFNIALTQPKFLRRSNLHRITLKAIFFKSPYRTADERLEDYYEDYANATKDALSKFGFHLLSHLADLYNFTLELHEALEWTPGDPLGPIARALMNNTADITGSPITMNIPRTYIFKYIHQDWPFRTCFIFRNPQPNKMKLKELLKPLTDDVWYLLILLVTLIFAILSALLKNEGIKPTVAKVSNSLLITVGALCQQGTEESMTRVSTRMTFLFLMIFSVLLYNYYSASIVSARLSEGIFKINDSLVQFGKLQLQMSSEPMSYLEFFLKKPDWDTSTFYKQYWLKLPVSKQLTSPEIGMRLVRKGGFAYHTHPNVAYPIIDKLYDNREICELMEVNVARPQFIAFGVTMNSSIVEIARVGLTKISETGLKNREVLRWQYRKPICRTDVLSSASVTIYEFAPHLFLLLLGMFIAIATYTVEIFVTNYADYTKKKISKIWRRNFLR